MRYHNITKDDMLNGDGLRVVLWVSGCPHMCKGCHNRITWNPYYGLAFDENAKREIFEELSKPYISGITLSGGDPLHPLNIDTIRELVLSIHNTFPNKTIWLYTGYDWDYVSKIDFIKYIDVVVDGEFIEDLKDTNLHWRGSSNQHVIDVKKSLECGEMIIHYSA